MEKSKIDNRSVVYVKIGVTIKNKNLGRWMNRKFFFYYDKSHKM